MNFQKVIYHSTEPLRGLLKRWATTAIRQQVWDYENRVTKKFLHEHIDEKYRSRINDWIERYCAGGDILDLGCSDAHVGYSLNPALYETYTGVDISTVSISNAVERQKQTGGWREEKNRHYVHDIVSYPVQHPMNVILFKDSLYYITPSILHEVLQYYKTFLKPGGVFIVHMDNIKRHNWIRKIIKDHFIILEENSILDPSGVLLIFN